MATLDDIADLAAKEQYLAVVSTLRSNLTIQSSLVNAGLLAHPTSGERVLAFVTYGPTKLRNLRARPTVTVAFRSGWQWGTVEGTAQIIGPDDPSEGFDAERIRVLLRDVFIGAGGQHDDWDAYDRAMAEQRRTAVLVTPSRIYSN
jgi:PPOX class probable F420-dependent enzyme